jgi:hypothetical protein
MSGSDPGRGGRLGGSTARFKPARLEPSPPVYLLAPSVTGAFKT